MTVNNVYELIGENPDRQYPKAIRFQTIFLSTHEYWDTNNNLNDKLLWLRNGIYHGWHGRPTAVCEWFNVFGKNEVII